MPRLAAAAQSFTATSTARPVLRPPSDLNELEREEFANIVLGVGPHHFVPVDVALIAILAKNIVLERIAFGELRAAVMSATGRARGWRSYSTRPRRSGRPVGRSA
jgi:hypothetical protein